MSDNKLHIIPIVEKGQTYDASSGSLILPEAGSFNVTIKEYQEDEKKIKELEKKKKDAKAFAIDKWEENEKKGWSQKKLREEYEKNIQEYEKLEIESGALLDKYKDVNWCWQLVGEKLDPNNLSHNESFNKGVYQIKTTGKHNVKFPEFLIGGGIAWLEAFHEKDRPTGTTPYGICVQTYGKPKIARIEWTDFEHNPITEKIGFTSKVLLHIYTVAMYGQEIEIKLTDNNSYNPKNETFLNVPVFKRQVNIKKLEKRDLGKKGVSGLLTKEGQNVSKDGVEKEQYTQKIELEILVEEAWDMHNGTVLSIFPVIKSIESGAFLEVGDGKALDLVSYGIPVTSIKQVSNKAVLIGTVGTNVASFSHCQYRALTLLDYNNKSTEIYRQNREVKDLVNLEIGILGFRNPKTYTIKTDDWADTSECNPKNKGKHNNIFSYDATKVNQELKVIKVEPKSIVLEASLDYDKISFFDFFWLSEKNRDKVPLLPIKLAHAVMNI